jgi:methylenetetrahydrofolate reductase (NADPH)
LPRACTPSAVSPAPQDDEEAVKAAGVAIGVKMCRALMDAGVKGLHFYTLNLEKVTYGIMKELGLYNTVEGGDE